MNKHNFEQILDGMAKVEKFIEMRIVLYGSAQTMTFNREQCNLKTKGNKISGEMLEFRSIREGVTYVVFVPFESIQYVELVSDVDVK